MRVSCVCVYFSCRGSAPEVHPRRYSDLDGAQRRAEEREGVALVRNSDLDSAPIYKSTQAGSTLWVSRDIKLKVFPDIFDQMHQIS